MAGAITRKPGYRPVTSINSTLRAAAKAVSGWPIPGAGAVLLRLSPALTIMGAAGTWGEITIMRIILPFFMLGRQYSAWYIGWSRSKPVRLVYRRPRKTARGLA